MITLQINLHLEHILHIEYKGSWELQKILYKDGRHYEVYISNKDLRWIKKYFVCRKRKGTKNLVFINPVYAMIFKWEDFTPAVAYNVKERLSHEIDICDISDTDDCNTNKQKIISLENEIFIKKQDFNKIKHHRKGKAFDDMGYKPIKPFNLKEYKARSQIYTRMFKEK